MGGSGKKLKAEFNRQPHKRGTVSMARAASPDSGDSQFFICFADARFLTANIPCGARSSPAWRMWTRSSAATREGPRQDRQGDAEAPRGVSPKKA